MAAAGRMRHALMAIAAQGQRQRVYVAADDRHRTAAVVTRPHAEVDGAISENPRWFSPPAYGLTQFADLFTSRQSVALATFSDLVAEARAKIVGDALAAGWSAGCRYEEGGRDAEAYADAIATYLGFSVSRLADYGSTIATWMPDPKNEGLRNTFARQALPMTWDFAEANPFSEGSGNFRFMLRGIVRVIESLSSRRVGSASQQDAVVAARDGFLISTDPPYYDNIGYSDLSDFFYVWLRRSLQPMYPELLATMLVPKSEELVANPYRLGGKENARTFFEAGFRGVFASVRRFAQSAFPITVYYAFKQSDVGEDGTASTGWETLLDGMIQTGWTITATWPMRSERAGRMISVGTNALASSIVLALRPRPEGAATIDRRGLIEALQAELPDALRDLQQSAVAPVDLPQAAIGPGMAVFSRHAKVIEDDGTAMTVRSALARINEILDQVLNEQEGDFDPFTRFAIAWYRQNGYATGLYGDAESLARARGTAVDAMVRAGVLRSAAGRVTLLAPKHLPPDYDVLNDDRVGEWEVLHHLIGRLETGGLPAAGRFLADVHARADEAVDVELVKELAFLLFSIAERSGWTRDALSFNTVATAWPDIVELSRAPKALADTPQAAFDF